MHRLPACSFSWRNEGSVSMDRILTATTACCIEDRLILRYVPRHTSLAARTTELA
jgi:hypothetical protein